MYKDETFATAESFYSFIDRAIPSNTFEDSDDYEWVIPYIVNASFACELYLKSFSSDGDSMTSGHSWDKIFDSLPEAKRQAILKHPHFNGDDEFYDKLIEGGRLFTSWRYCFEHNRPKSVEFIFLGNFLEAIRELARDDLNESTLQ